MENKKNITHLHFQVSYQLLNEMNEGKHPRLVEINERILEVFDELCAICSDIRNLKAGDEECIKKLYKEYSSISGKDVVLLINMLIAKKDELDKEYSDLTIEWEELTGLHYSVETNTKTRN